MPLKHHLCPLAFLLCITLMLGARYYRKLRDLCGQKSHRRWQRYDRWLG